MSTGKIYAISDLHVDQDKNLKWVEELSNEKYLNDTVIIAGKCNLVCNKVLFIDFR